MTCLRRSRHPGVIYISSTGAGRMGVIPKAYSKEFKQRAIDLVLVEGAGIVGVAAPRGLGAEARRPRH